LRQDLKQEYHTQQEENQDENDDSSLAQGDYKGSLVCSKHEEEILQKDNHL